MRTEHGFDRWRSRAGVLRMLLAGAGLVSMFLGAACVEKVPDYKGAVYDEANRGANGAFVLQEISGSGGVALPDTMTYSWWDKQDQEHKEPVLVRAWSYRYKWVQNGQTYVSNWVDSGRTPDGSPVCRVTIRPSEVPELNEALLQSGGPPVESIVCETVARIPAFRESGEWVQEIPISVVIAGN